jgi:DNA-binding transcriptional ArsR family regulator
MVNNIQDLNSIFAALADPTRRAIVERLAEGDSTVTELAQPFEMSLPAVSKHLKYLERAGLLVREVDGRVHHCRLRPDPLQQAAQWMNRYRHFWEGQFEALAGYLEETILESDETQDDEETDDNR